MINSRHKHFEFVFFTFHYFLLMCFLSQYFWTQDAKVDSLISCTVYSLVQYSTVLSQSLSYLLFICIREKFSMHSNLIAECFTCLDHPGFLLDLHSKISKSSGEWSCFNHHGDMCSSHRFDNVGSSTSGYISCFIHEVSQWHLQGQYLFF